MRNTILLIKNKYKSISVVKKAVIWFTFCNFFQKGVATLTIPIFTRILTTEEYGLYSLYLSWFNIIVIFTSLNLQFASFNNAMIKYKNRRNEYVATIQSLIILITSIIGFGIFFLRNKVSDFLDMSEVLVMALLIDLMFEPIIEIWNSRQRIEYNYKKVVFVTCLKSLLNPFLGIIVVIYSSNFRAEMRVFSLVFVDVVIALPIMINSYLKSKKIYVFEFGRYALNFNIPMIPHYISGVMLNQSDRIMIEKYVSLSKAGIYSIAYSIGTLVQLVINSIINAITPWIYEKLEEEKYDEICENTKKYFVFVAVIVVILIIVSPELTILFAGKQYYEAIYIIPSVAVAIYFFFVANIYTILELFYEKKVYTLIASSGAAIINLFFNWLLIPKWGYLVAGYTTLFGYILLAIFHICACIHLKKKNGIKTKIFQTELVFEGMIALLIFMVIAIFLYKFLIIRYFILGILLIVLYKCKHQLLKFFVKR